MAYGKAKVLLLALLGTTVSIGTYGVVAAGMTLFDGSESSVLEAQEQYAQAAREAATGEQRNILSDGEVSTEEYESALVATVSCLHAKGFASAEVVSGEGMAPPRLRMSSSVDRVPSSESALEACRVQHLSEVEVVWSLQQMNPDPDAFQAALFVLNSCMSEQLSTVHQFRTTDDVEAFLAEAVVAARVEQRSSQARAYFAICRPRVLTETGVPLP